eukprot:CAMPEP_0194287206 /NCGR_PEP_ID=MMETSP0169-20130528/34256_1 /TAXON_ID=218684 /ORGANISM="Corethron pennatum, Strain L29A3" /LENGTH=388 /DNA_ID=CAMNT_0039033845 /DNA_START=28 /DNA_END=1191 /DNA_ORIENTATION=+
MSEGDAAGPPPPREGIDFENLPWNLNEPDAHSYVHLKTASTWSEAHYDPSTETGSLLTDPSCLVKYSSTPLELYPSATSLNYGTTIWEGLKCYRQSDGVARVFRPDMNYARFRRGAAAMCLPPPSYALFMRSIQRALVANGDLVPPVGDGMKLYVRPMLLGSGQQLGLYPSPQFSLLFYVSPTGNYFKGATAGLKLHLETLRCRAARGGTGNVKCSGNYAVTLRPLMDAKAQGFGDNLYLELDSYKSGQLDDAVLQELSAANFFLVLRTGEIATPSLARGTILPGVTRDSVLALARSFVPELQQLIVASTNNPDAVVTVSERDVTAGEIKRAAEAFVTGTAAEVVPVGSVATGRGEEAFEAVLPHGADAAGGPITAKLLSMLREVMAG